MANGPQPGLTPAELEALFNILTHAQTWDEVRDLRYEQNLAKFGPPFTPANGGASPFPLLQQLTATMLSPTLFTPEGWAGQMALGQRLAAVNLSDSYDKGFVGLRKEAATGWAAGLESVLRGLLVGRARDPTVDLATLHTKTYDRSDAKAVEQAWDDCVQGLLYGDLLDRLFDNVKTSASLDDVPPVARAALDYLMVCSATVLHYFTVLTPEGQNLIKMQDLVGTLTPYTIIKQTVRVGNVQSMLNGIVKIMLAQVGGKTLVQTILSRSIKVDLPDLEKKAEKLVKKKECPKEIAAAVDDYVSSQPRATQEKLRARSQQEGKSMVAIILATFYPSHPPVEVLAMSEAQHAAALEYLSLKLSIRDRVESVRTVCKEKPDILSSMVKESVGLLEPMLKTLHEGKFDIGKLVNLHKKVNEDLVKTAKVTKSYKPGVSDFFDFYSRQTPEMWRLLHEGATKCPSLHSATYAWMRHALDQFQAQDQQAGEAKTGPLTGPLLGLFEQLPTEQQGAIRQALNEQAAYLAASRAQSQQKLQDVLSKKSPPDSIGPGAILPRWHALLDGTVLTPAQAAGPVQVARSLEGAGARQQHAVAPDTSMVVQALGPAFREYLMAHGGAAFSMRGVAASLQRTGSLSAVGEKMAVMSAQVSEV